MFPIWTVLTQQQHNSTVGKADAIRETQKVHYILAPEGKTRRMMTVMTIQVVPVTPSNAVYYIIIVGLQCNYILTVVVGCSMIYRTPHAHSTARPQFSFVLVSLDAGSKEH